MIPRERSGLVAGAAALAAIAAVAGAVALHLAAPITPFDDAYIPFRYVAHLFEGRGAIYNDGQRVLGVSSPLYTAWLALLKWLLPAIELPVLAVRFNALFHAAAALLAGLLVRRLGFGALAAAAVTAAIALSEGILRASLGGMESSLFLALLFGALLAAATRWDGSALALAGLAALARPEGMILVALLLGAALLDRAGRPGILRVAIGLLPLAAGVAAMTLYYGSPIPHSIVAKARPLYALPDGWALRALGTHAGSWLLAPLPGLTEAASRTLFPIAGGVVTLWGLIGWWRANPVSVPRARGLALPLFPALLGGAYAAGNPLLLPWYYPLVQAPWLALILAAALWRDAGRLWRVAGLAVALLLIVSTAKTLGAALAGGPRDLMSHGALDATMSAQLEAYAEAARWLDARAAPADRVAAAEIGRLGYLLDRPILDGCGLVSPEAIPYLPVPAAERGRQLGAIPSALVRGERPEWVVALPAFIHSSLLEDPAFLEGYELAHEVPFRPEDPFYSAVLIFRRRS